MGHVNNRLTDALSDFLQILFQAKLRLGIDVGYRLVKKDNGRLPRDRPGKGDPLRIQSENGMLNIA